MNESGVEPGTIAVRRRVSPVARHGFLRRLRSPRLQGMLALGVLAVIGTSGTLAAWTDQVTVTGATFSTGTIDLKVNGLDSNVPFTTMSLSNMVPGDSSAGVLTIKNAGTAPLRYTASTTATDPSGTGLPLFFGLNVTAAAATSGSAPRLACAGTDLNGAGALEVPNGSLIASARTLAPGASETVCVQATLSNVAPTTVQGASTNLTLTFNATSF
jgi:predicted ribosomally synthesized peptide with SipW-like signal peptide